MHRGYIKLFRCLKDNDLWQIKPFSKGQAWVDMLFLANHKDTAFEKRGQIVKVKRGQIGISEKGLADRWGWSRKKVANFLKYLEKAHQIAHQKSNITTLITITNYDHYNSEEHQPEHQGHTIGTPKAHQKHTSKDLKNEENDNNSLEEMIKLLKQNFLMPTSLQIMSLKKWHNLPGAVEKFEGALRKTAGCKNPATRWAWVDDIMEGRERKPRDDDKGTALAQFLADGESEE